MPAQVRAESTEACLDREVAKASRPLTVPIQTTPWAELPQVDLDQIEGREPIAPDGRTPGYGYFRLEEGYLHGRHIFIKISKALASGQHEVRSLAHVETECAWFRYLNENGFEPQFQGV